MLDQRRRFHLLFRALIYYVFWLGKFWEENWPLSHSSLMIKWEVIIVLHDKPKRILRVPINNYFRTFLCNFFLFKALKGRYVCSYVLHNFSCGKVDLNGSGLCLPCDYALVLTVEKFSKILILDIKWRSLKKSHRISHLLQDSRPYRSELDSRRSREWIYCPQWSSYRTQMSQSWVC